MSESKDIFRIQAGYHGRERYLPSYIPMWLAEIAYEEYKRRNGFGCQTLERLNERGGLGREELIDLLCNTKEHDQQTRDEVIEGLADKLQMRLGFYVGMNGSDKASEFMAETMNTIRNMKGR